MSRLIATDKLEEMLDKIEPYVPEQKVHVILRKRGTKDEIPFPETRAYVAKVLSAERKYRSKYASQLYG